MRYTEDELRERANPAPIEAVRNDHPWGLCINLENEQLDKLAIEGECEVGDTIHLCCTAKVTSCSERQTEGGTDRRIELQITEIGVPGDGEHEAAPSREERVKRRYGESGGHEEGGGNVDAGERHITKRAYEAA